MLKIDSLDYAERFVKKQQRLGNDVRWENYDIVFFRPSPRAASSRHGAFRNGAWGFENSYEVNSNGEWLVDWRDVRRDRRMAR